MGTYLAIIKRDLVISYKDGDHIAMGFGFFLVIISLLPIGIGSDIDILPKVGPVLLWIAFLLSTLFTISRLFKDDHVDGTMDFMIMDSAIFEIIIICKVFAYWISITLPLIIVIPIMSILLNISMDLILPITFIIFISSPAFVFIAAVGSALTLGMERSGILITILILPLYIPLIIVGISATNINVIGINSYSVSVMLISGFSMLSIALAPFLISLILRTNSY
ncbi:heme exporter protein CcmB [Hyphomicrobiales bacterium]|nr:heme exporter protein CcmB [Hyphomicrobiales bacterium]